MEKKKLPPLVYNWTSSIGAVVAVVAGLAIVFLLLISLVSKTINPYLGILLYMILPALLVLGLLLIPIGMYIQWRSRQKPEEISYLKWPSLDLSNSRHRNAVLVFLIGTLLFVFISSVGIYQAYHYTESVAFCGLTCHTVMQPEYTAYQDSPHARVKCVDCHIGPGAGWYARSKLSGLYQVYAVIANVYPRPIPTPIKDLRPAQETCEQCHWPKQFYGAKQREFDHYFYDKANTHWPINMLIKIGGGSSLNTAHTAGIHWHMNIAVQVEYIARDKQRQDIPWIRVTDRQTGRTAVYQDSARPLSQGEIAAAKPRTMDCMDCHDRPSHSFHSPDYEIDRAILTGQIAADIPEIKQVSVNAMIKEPPSEAEALAGIAASITDFYRAKYSQRYLQKEKEIKDAIRATQEAYARNIFPGMKTKWTDYPDNIGHFIFPGCMRCHDGKHKSSSGLIVPNDCRACHVILSQGTKGRSRSIDLQTGLEFRHPVDIGDAWKNGACYDCHRGVGP